MIHAGRRTAATARVTATAPWTGTHLIASYQVTGDHRWASPGHSYSTASVRQMPGLNLYVRQTIPGLGMLPWRMEATADLRNLLAQGYLSLGTRGRAAIDAGGESTQRSRRTELHFLSERPATGAFRASIPTSTSPPSTSLPCCFPFSNAIASMGRWWS